jgi:hypothetical protein
LIKSYLYFILPAVVVMIIILAGAYGKKKKAGLDAGFRKALSGLELRFGSFYRKLIAAGFYHNHPVYFYYFPAAQNEMIPLTHDTAILCGMKIPGVKRAPLHLVALRERGPSPSRKAAGWMNPEPGFFLAAARGGSGEESLRLYRRLSRDTTSALSGCAMRLGSATLVPDWLDVIVGRKHTLELFSDYNGKLSSLELQVKVPFNIQEKELAETLKEMEAVINLVSKDLGEPDCR